MIDKVYARRKQPFAFDAATSPFGELKDNYSYYSVDNLGGLKLKDFCDGYIIPCSIDEAEPVASIRNWISSEAESAKIKDTLLPSHSGQRQSIQDFLESLEKNKLRIFKSMHDVDR